MLTCRAAIDPTISLDRENFVDPVDTDDRRRRRSASRR